jgi:hypothetical protein
MAATLADELAHAVTHGACDEMPRDVRDVIAESVADAVGSRFGLDLLLRSVDYVMRRLVLQGSLFGGRSRTDDPTG